MSHFSFFLSYNSLLPFHFLSLFHSFMLSLFLAFFLFLCLFFPSLFTSYWCWQNSKFYERFFVMLQNWLVTPKNKEIQILNSQKIGDNCENKIFLSLKLHCQTTHNPNCHRLKTCMESKFCKNPAWWPHGLRCQYSQIQVESLCRLGLRFQFCSGHI